MSPHRLLKEVGANYSAYRIRSLVGVLNRHLMEPNKYSSWTLLLGLWAPEHNHPKKEYKPCLCNGPNHQSCQFADKSQGEYYSES